MTLFILIVFLIGYIVVDGLHTRQRGIEGKWIDGRIEEARKISNIWHTFSFFWLIIITVLSICTLEISLIKMVKTAMLVGTSYFLLHETFLNISMKRNVFDLGDGKNEMLYDFTIMLSKKLNISKYIIRGVLLVILFLSSLFIFIL